MSATSQQPTSSAPTHPPGPLALVVELDHADHNAMLRVLTLLARRRCRVTRASFGSDPHGGCDLLSLELDGPRHLDRNVVAWVAGLVSVRSVRVRSVRQPAPDDGWRVEREGRRR